MSEGIIAMLVFTISMMLLLILNQILEGKHKEIVKPEIKYNTVLDMDTKQYIKKSIFKSKKKYREFLKWYNQLIKQQL